MLGERHRWATFAPSFIACILQAYFLCSVSPQAVHASFAGLHTNARTRHRTGVFIMGGGRRRRTRSSTTTLYGINEWRDTLFDDAASQNVQDVSEGGIPREICVMPFPYQDVLVQGETKELRLYEERFKKLFEKSMSSHGGVIAMGLFANESGILKTVPICEIESFNRMEEFGIFCTIRVVSRASLVRVTQEIPYIEAVCVEKVDKVPEKLNLLNLLAGNIENFMVTLSSLEYKLDEIMDNGNNKLPDVKYEDDDDDDDLDRNGRFQEAFLTAKNSDCQGYMVSTSSTDTERSMQDLTAISWAVFSAMRDSASSAIRIQALDSTDLLSRLHIGLYVLREKRKDLEAKIALVGKNDDDSTSACDI